MGKVKTTWLLPGHSGRACHHESIYTKQNRKTGQVYSVQLCNPNSDWTDAQLEHRSSFGTVVSALSQWIAENKTANSEAYQKVMATYDRQTKYSTLRGMMLAKGMAELQSDGSVLITIGTYTATVTAGAASSAGAGSASGGTSTGGSL